MIPRLRAWVMKDKFSSTEMGKFVRWAYLKDKAIHIRLASENFDYELDIRV